jgi:hypothetical protein
MEQLELNQLYKKYFDRSLKQLQTNVENIKKIGILKDRNNDGIEEAGSIYVTGQKIEYI